MVDTGYPRTMALARPSRQRRVEDHATDTDWQVMRAFEVTPPTSQPWHAAAYCVVDVDPGVTGQLRIRTSADVAWTPTVVPVTGFARNVRLGFEAIPGGTQTVFIEARRTAGAGGVRLINAHMAIVSAPPLALQTSTPSGGGGNAASYAYLWESRPAYVEPNPAAAVGTEARSLADAFGLTRRVTVANTGQFAAAVAAFQPGDQIYATANIVGDGASVTCGWYGTNAPAGGGGTAPSGTATHPGMITCAPGIWIDGGQTAGAENLNSRALYLAGVNHVWLYGANIRRANFPLMFNQCSGTVDKAVRVWYCNIQDAGHSLFAIAGNFALGGQSSYIDVRYNEISNSGLANQEFGEGIYVGYGSSNSPTLQNNHHITIIANHFTSLTAEACDMKAGTDHLDFIENLIENCNDHASPARVGNAANVGFPGAFQHPGQTAHPSAAWNPASRVIGNRWKNCTSASTKFPDALVLLGHRGFTVAGNLFDGINVGTAALIQAYIDNNVPTTFGQSGTFEVHNNTARNCNSMSALYRVKVGGPANPTQEALALANTNRSNNVISNSPSASEGANYTVAAAAFTNDGTGYTGSDSAVAPGGALDVNGSDTTAWWTSTYAGEPVIAPVAPGARQRIAASSSGGGTSPTVRGLVVGGAGASVTITTANWTTPPQTGDRILWIIPAAGPGAVASVTWTTPAGTLVTDAPGSGFNPRMRVLLQTFTGQTSWAFSINNGAQLRPIGIALTGATTAVAGTASSVFSNAPDAPAVANPANALGILAFTANFSDGQILAGPSDHLQRVLSTAILYQVYVGTKVLSAAGTYNPGPGSLSNAGENTTALAIVVS